MKSGLVCWISSFNGLAVVTSQLRMDEIKAIHDAKTWEEFAEADPAAFEEVREYLEEEDEEVPPMDSSFDVSMVPGFDQGDYPPWLQTEIALHVPRDILDRYGRLESSVLNGAFWVVEAGQLDAMIEALRTRGFEVKRVEDLPFQ